MTTKNQRPGSLSEFEVSIIKNLISTSRYSNQEILGMINAVRRTDGRADTNGGRISDVKTGKPKYHTFSAASDKVTADFVKRAGTPASVKASAEGPFATDVIKRLFPANQSLTGHLAITETDCIECKENFGGYWINNCLQTIAAFANNAGGYLLFGVKNHTWEVTGIDGDKFKGLDRRDVNQLLRPSLSTGIDFDTCTMDFGSKTIGLMYVYPAKIKPVIFLKTVNAASAAEGHIYYRYQGENRLIGPTELQYIIEERLRSISETVLFKHLQNILSNGIENSAVVNLDTGRVDGKSGSFVIDEKILPQISFIKEGEFQEKTGAPALKLIGEVTSSAKVVIKDENLVHAYPYTFLELVRQIKSINPEAKPNMISKIIRTENMKKDRRYSALVFPNKSQQEQYQKTGIIKNSTPSIYNDKCVKAILKLMRHSKQS